ncbi:uncharacterized protein MELLADRAFT_31548, partial [Melampsora larici-populina 98AG31]
QETYATDSSTDEEMSFASHLSYEGLTRNDIPCSKKGTSAQNCQQPGTSANPYTRGCNKIDRCR